MADVNFERIGLLMGIVSMQPNFPALGRIHGAALAELNAIEASLAPKVEKPKAVPAPIMPKTAETETYTPKRGL